MIMRKGHIWLEKDYCKAVNLNAESLLWMSQMQKFKFRIF